MKWRRRQVNVRNAISRSEMISPHQVNLDEFHVIIITHSMNVKE
jgi:hypothetical protein